MTPLERAGQAVGIRPMIWQLLDESEAFVLRHRIRGLDLGEVAKIFPGRRHDKTLIYDLEKRAIRRVLKEEKLAIKLDRKGLARRYT